MSSHTKRIFLFAQIIIALVAMLSLGACGSGSHVTQSLTGLDREAGEFKRIKPPPPPPAVAALQSVTLAPAAVAGGASSQGTLLLTSAAPAGGAVVTLTSSDAATASVPASVTIAAGATSATFTVTTVPVAANASVVVTATYNALARTATLTVNAPAVVSATLASVALAPASVTAGSPSQGTVTLSAAAPAGGALIALSSSLPAAAALPASVTIAAGATSATFAISTPPAVAASSAIISAAYNGVSRTATLAIAASDPCVSVNSLGGAAVIVLATVPQFRTGRLRVDLVGDVPLGWINAMGPCSALTVPAVKFLSGTGDVTLAGTTTSITGAGTALTFGPLTLPIAPPEPGVVLALDAAGNVLQVIWPALAGLPAGPPVLRMNLVSWSPAVQEGVSLDANMTFNVQGPDGSVATFTARGTNMVVPAFRP